MEFQSEKITSNLSVKAPKLLKSMYSFINKTLTKDYLSVSVSYYMKSHTKHELKLGSG